MQNSMRGQRHTTDLLFTLGLFSVFAAAAFLLVMIGIRVYQGTVAQMQDTYSTRTALSYAVEKVRQHDTAGGAALTEVEDTPALLLADVVGGEIYYTYLYSYEGSLCELTLRAGTEAELALGEKILAVEDMTIEDGGSGFIVLAARGSDGDTVRCLVHPRSELP